MVAGLGCLCIVLFLTSSASALFLVPATLPIEEDFEQVAPMYYPQTTGWDQYGIGLDNRQTNFVGTDFSVSGDHALFSEVDAIGVHLAEQREVVFQCRLLVDGPLEKRFFIGLNDRVDFNGIRSIVGMYIGTDGNFTVRGQLEPGQPTVPLISMPYVEGVWYSYKIVFSMTEGSGRIFINGTELMSVNIPTDRELNFAGILPVANYGDGRIWMDDLLIYNPETAPSLDTSNAVSTQGVLEYGYLLEEGFTVDADILAATYDVERHGDRYWIDMDTDEAFNVFPPMAGINRYITIDTVSHEVLIRFEGSADHMGIMGLPFTIGTASTALWDDTDISPGQDLFGKLQEGVSGDFRVDDPGGDFGIYPEPLISSASGDYIFGTVGSRSLIGFRDHATNIGAFVNADIADIILRSSIIEENGTYFWFAYAVGGASEVNGAPDWKYNWDGDLPAAVDPLEYQEDSITLDLPGARSVNTFWACFADEQNFCTARINGQTLDNLTTGGLTTRHLIVHGDTLNITLGTGWDHHRVSNQIFVSGFAEFPPGSMDFPEIPDGSYNHTRSRVATAMASLDVRLTPFSEEESTYPIHESILRPVEPFHVVPSDSIVLDSRVAPDLDQPDMFPNDPGRMIYGVSVSASAEDRNPLVYPDFDNTPVELAVSVFDEDGTEHRNQLHYWNQDPLKSEGPGGYDLWYLKGSWYREVSMTLDAEYHPVTGSPRNTAWGSQFWSAVFNQGSRVYVYRAGTDDLLDKAEFLASDTAHLAVPAGIQVDIWVDNDLLAENITVSPGTNEILLEKVWEIQGVRDGYMWGDNLDVDITWLSDVPVNLTIADSQDNVVFTGDAVDGGSTWERSIPVPSSWDVGEYSLVVRLWTGKEYLYRNTSFQVDSPMNIIVNDVSYDPEDFYHGDDVDIVINITRDLYGFGGAPVLLPVSVRIGSVTTWHNTTIQDDISLRVPWSVISGKHQIFVSTDPQDILAETQEFDNTFFTSQTVYAVPHPDGGGDRTVMVGRAVTFRSNSTDIDGTIVEHAWDWDGDEAYDSFGANQSRVFPFEGTFEVRLKVTDNDGLQAVHLFEVVVEKSDVVRPPTLSIDGPTSMFIHEEGTLTATSVDLDGTIVAYRWDLDGDGTYELEGMSATATFSSDTPGDVEVGVQVESSTGEMTNATHGITVVEMDIHVDAGPDRSAVNGTEVVFYPTWGKDADRLRYRWDFDDDGVWDLDVTDVPTSRHLYSSTGEFTARFEVTYPQGSFNDTTTVTVTEPVPDTGDSDGGGGLSFVLDPPDRESQGLGVAAASVAAGAGIGAAGAVGAGVFTSMGSKLASLLGGVEEAFEEWTEDKLMGKKTEGSKKPSMGILSFVLVFLFVIVCYGMAFYLNETGGSITSIRSGIDMDTFITAGLAAAIGVASIIIIVEVFEIGYMRMVKGRSTFRVWTMGAVALLASSVIFKAPFGFPGGSKMYARKRWITENAALAKVSLVLSLYAVFYMLILGGLTFLEPALSVSLMFFFYLLLPIKPLEGHRIYQASKPVWGGLFGLSLLLYFGWQLAFLPVGVFIGSGFLGLALFGMTSMQGIVNRDLSRVDGKWVQEEEVIEENVEEELVGGQPIPGEGYPSDGPSYDGPGPVTPQQGASMQYGMMDPNAPPPSSQGNGQEGEGGYGGPQPLVPPGAGGQVTDAGQYDWRADFRSRMQSKDMDGAVSVVDNVVASEPANTEAWFMRGNLLSRMGRHPEAIDSFDRVLAVDSTDVKAANAKAQTLKASGDLQAALMWADHVLGMQPGFAAAEALKRSLEAEMASVQEVVVQQAPLQEAPVEQVPVQPDPAVPEVSSDDDLTEWEVEEDDGPDEHPGSVPEQPQPIQEQPAQQTYPCATCGQPLGWVQEHERWYCYTCQNYP